MDTTAKRTTIKDVASRAGVSPTTVSMVMNGKPVALPEETRARVKKAAEELHYYTDFNARAMVMGKTNIIGVIVPDISNMFFAEALHCIQVACAERGYDIILCNSEELAENDFRYIKLLAGRNVDGLIYSPSAESLTEENIAKIKSLLQPLKLPHVFFDRFYSEKEPYVVVDNEESSYRAARYLIEAGHRKIGAIAGPLTLNSSRNRLEGLRRALAEAGESLPDNMIVTGKYDYETGRTGGEKLIKEGASAIFAFSDMQAYGVYESAKELGVKIPEDLSVFGFDDTFYSSLLETPLTTMRQPVKTLAEEACRVILDLIEGKKTQRSVKLPAEIVERKSVGVKEK